MLSSRGGLGLQFREPLLTLKPLLAGKWNQPSSLIQAHADMGLDL
jgi:hypothetical protein